MTNNVKIGGITVDADDPCARYAALAAAKASQSNEAITNQNGTTDRVGTPVSPSANVAFADTGVDYSALMRAPRQSVTIVEEFTGVTHHYVNAFFTGNSENNRLNGEVSGLTLVGEAYRRTAG
ncbi:hypothetical protein [Pararhizobium sp. LjRoot238]|uniref:hypothetical protein n=1 Tax=Pararhizobium sp. LjRoot238 TaxID=3342293 RepID=UPI003ECFE3E4